MKKFLIVSEDNLQSTKIAKATKEDIDWLKTHGYEVFLDLKKDEKKIWHLLEEKSDFDGTLYYFETSLEEIFL